jgi:hypothetical protein
MLGNTIDKTYSAENTVTSYTKRCIIEWNMNYYFNLSSIPDSMYGGSEREFFKRFFPLNEVARGWRPPAGAFKLRIGDSRVHSLQWPGAGNRSDINFYANTPPTDNTYTLKTRLYTVKEDTNFKYYDSPYPIGHASYDDPYIEYDVNYLYANKITVTFQRAAGMPKNFSIQIKNSSNIWTTIATFSNVSAVGADGSVNVYYDGVTWSTTVPDDDELIPENTVNVRGIKVIVTSMGNASNATLPSASTYLSIIEMSPRALLSFTDRLMDWEWDGNLAEDDTILPIGSMSTNSGSVTLSNNDGLLEPDLEATTPSYSYFMRKYGKVFVSYKAAVLGSTEIKQFTGYIEKPESTGVYESITLQLFDKLMFSKEIKAQDMVLEKHSTTAIIYTLLDLAGIGPIKVKHVPGEAEPKPIFFYSSKEESVFDAIQELCRAHQYAVSVDEDDNVVIYTKNYIFANKSQHYVLTTDNITDSSIDYLPNISSYSDSQKEIINSVNITYRPLLASSAPDPDNLVKNQVAVSRARTLELWRPTQPILLGVAKLIKPLGASDTQATIDRTALRNTAWGSLSGYFLVDSEIIKFDGVELEYTPKAGAPASPQIVRNNQEYAEVVSYARGAVTFNGKLKNLERGMFGTTPAAHSLALSGWEKSPAAKLTSGTGGNGYLQIRSTRNGPKSVAYAVKVIDPDSYWVNTRMIIQNINTKTKSAGLLVSANTSGSGVSGIYVEISAGVNNKSGRVSVYRVNNSVIKRSHLTAPVNFDIPLNKPFNVSVFYKKADGVDKRRIAIFINEEKVMRRTISTNMSLTKKVGMAATGDTSALFDYIYGGREPEDSNTQTNHDGVLRNYVSEMVKRDRTQLSYSRLPTLASIGFERFDDYAREIYVEDIRFNDRGPALSIEGKLTATEVRDRTNKKNVALASEIGGSIWGTSPFGATVTVGNLSSTPLVVAYVDDSGQESLYPFVWGNVVEEFAESRVEVSNESSIFRNGEKKYEFSSRWINNKTDAQAFAKYTLMRGESGKLEVTVDAWSPHVLQLGDEVRLYIPEKGIDKEFVVFAINKSGDDVVKANIKLVER